MFLSVRCQPLCHISVGPCPSPPPALNPCGSSFSQSSVDVNKHNDEEVQEGANDPQQGQDGLLSFLFTLLRPNLLYTDGGRPHSDPPPLSPGCLSVEKQESRMRQTIDKQALIQRPDRTLGGAARRVTFPSLLMAQLRVWRNEHKRGCFPPHLCDGFPPQKMIFPAELLQQGDSRQLDDLLYV